MWRHKRENRRHKAKVVDAFHFRSVWPTMTKLPTMLGIGLVKPPHRRTVPMTSQSSVPKLSVTWCIFQIFPSKIPKKWMQIYNVWYSLLEWNFPALISLMMRLTLYSMQTMSLYFCQQMKEQGQQDILMEYCIAVIILQQEINRLISRVDIFYILKKVRTRIHQKFRCWCSCRQFIPEPTTREL